MKRSMKTALWMRVASVAFASRERGAPTRFRLTTRVSKRISLDWEAL